MKVWFSLMKKFLLTTTDNPYNPHTQFEQWLAEDRRLGHHSLELLGRIIVSSDELSVADQELAYQDAVNEIVEENLSGVHALVYYSDSEEPIVVR